MNRTTLENLIFSVISNITGLRPEQLESDMFLESELGLDSIKMLEFFNGLVQLIPEEKKAAFSSKFPVQTLMRIQTIEEAIEIVREWQDFDEVKGGSCVFSKNISDEPENSTEQVELLHSQYLHLLSHWLIDSNSLCYTLRLHGAFDLNLASQCWKALLDRHPMLRVRFSIPAEATSFKDYQLRVQENLTPPEIPVTDLRHLNSQEQEKTIDDEFHRWLNYQWQLTECPLHRFFVFRLADSVYQLFFANEHLIADGLGVQLILREFLEIYRARACGEEPDLLPATTIQDYHEIVQRMNDWQAPEEEQAYSEYTKRQGKESYCWNLARNNSDRSRPEFRNLPCQLGRDLTAKLIAKTREWRVPLNSLLLAAFIKAATKLERERSSSKIVIQVPTSGRVYPGVDASNAVSSFAQNLALDFARPHPDEKWETLIDRVHQEIQQGLSNGYDRVQSQQMAAVFRDAIALENGKLPEHTKSLFRFTAKSNLFFPYTGHTHIQTRYGDLEVSDYRAGGINAIGTLDLLQEIFDDRLHFFASYDANCFSESLIDRLLQEYIVQLQSFTNERAIEHQAMQPMSTDVAIESVVREIASQVCHCPITDELLDRDLEADLGMDSLESIRIVTGLEKQMGKLDRQALLSCRSLREMTSVLSESRLPKSIEIPYLEIIEQVKRSPNAIAVLDGDTQLTYRELHRLSNQVANYLKTLGVKPGNLIGVMLDPGFQMWIAILGIIKAGGAYVPLDPTCPTSVQ